MSDHKCKICRSAADIRVAVETDLDSGMLLRDAELKWNFSRSMLSLHGRWLKEERALALRKRQMAGRQIDLRNRRVFTREVGGKFRLAVVYGGHANASHSYHFGEEPVFVEESDLKATDVVLTLRFDDPLPDESGQEEQS